MGRGPRVCGPSRPHRPTNSCRAAEHPPVARRPPIRNRPGRPSRQPHAADHPQARDPRQRTPRPERAIGAARVGASGRSRLDRTPRARRRRTVDRPDPRERTRGRFRRCGGQCRFRRSGDQGPFRRRAGHGRHRCGGRSRHRHGDNPVRRRAGAQGTRSRFGASLGGGGPADDERDDPAVRHRPWAPACGQSRSAPRDSRRPADHRVRHCAAGRLGQPGRDVGSAPGTPVGPGPRVVDSAFDRSRGIGRHVAGRRDGAGIDRPVGRRGSSPSIRVRAAGHRTSTGGRPLADPLVGGIPAGRPPTNRRSTQRRPTHRDSARPRPTQPRPTRRVPSRRGSIRHVPTDRLPTRRLPARSHTSSAGQPPRIRLARRINSRRINPRINPSHRGSRVSPTRRPAASKHRPGPDRPRHRRTLGRARRRREGAGRRPALPRAGTAASSEPHPGPGSRVERVRIQQVRPCAADRGQIDPATGWPGVRARIDRVGSRHQPGGQRRGQRVRPSDQRRRGAPCCYPSTGIGPPTLSGRDRFAPPAAVGPERLLRADHPPQRRHRYRERRQRPRRGTLPRGTLPRGALPRAHEGGRADRRGR